MPKPRVIVFAEMVPSNFIPSVRPTCTESPDCFHDPLLTSPDSSRWLLAISGNSHYLFRLQPDATREDLLAFSLNAPVLFSRPDSRWRPKRSHPRGFSNKRSRGKPSASRSKRSLAGRRTNRTLARRHAGSDRRIRQSRTALQMLGRGADVRTQHAFQRCTCGLPQSINALRRDRWPQASGFLRYWGQ
jgi:hypothetical protein